VSLSINIEILIYPHGIAKSTSGVASPKIWGGKKLWGSKCLILSK